MRKPVRGFTIVELVVAAFVLVVGVTALASSSGLSTRLVGRGRTATVAAAVAQARLDRLRAAARASAVPCDPGSGADAFASSPAPVPTQGVTESWTVTGGGATRQVEVVVRYAVPGGARADTFRTLVLCEAP